MIRSLAVTLVVLALTTLHICHLSADMKYNTLFGSLMILSGTAVSAASNATNQQPPAVTNQTSEDVIKANPLPAPVSINWDTSSGQIGIDQGLSINGDQNDVISDAFKRTMDSITKVRYTPQAINSPYKPILRKGETANMSALTKQKRADSSANGGASVKQVDLKVEDLDADLQLGVDEAYTMNVTSDSIAIVAKTTWGAIHAFKTLQQLIIYDDDSQFHIEHPVSISDSPEYPHRGVMLDTARHFLTVDSILRQIDTMHLSKLNTLHWHMTDSQSWPIQVDSVPEMIQGAYSSKEVYTKDDIKNIVDYAYHRGVRVVPEIDMPGHSFKGWESADPDLLACATSLYSNNINNYQLDILNDKVYDYLKKIYDELSAIFRDDVFHVGADELITSCFKYSQRTQDWFAQNSSRKYGDLLDHWFEKSLPIFNNTKTRRVAMWEDAVISTTVSASNVPKDAIMQNWNTASTNLPKLIDWGYDVVVSDQAHWYLDCGYAAYLNGEVAVSSCDPYKGWQYIYSFNFVEGLSEDQIKKVMGGEVTLFGEQVDSTVLEQKLWPRAAALAELLWSGNKDSNGNYRATEMGQRIQNFREYLVALGVNAPPLQPKFCIQNPHYCDYDVYVSHV